MISTSEFRRGARILLDGEPWSLEDYTVQTPSARGAATLLRCRLRHLVHGTLAERTFKSGERFEEADVVFRQAQVLYDDGESVHFMDAETFEQTPLDHGRLGEARPWLAEGLALQAVVWNGAIVNVALPQHVEAVVDMVGAGSRGDTASGKTLKQAVLTNGVTVRVPLFVEAGETILVDPRNREFVRRVR